MRLKGFLSDHPHRFLMSLNGSRGFIPIFVDQERIPAPPPLKFHLRIKDEGLHRQTQETFLANLRRLADGWITTGRDASGSGEQPRKRKLTRKLRRAVNDWWAGRPPIVDHDYSGELVVSMPVCRMNFAAPLEAAEEEAVRQFAAFLDSPYRYRLCKCRSCSEYYYIDRQPPEGPRGFIKYGTYCPRHRHLASAQRSNERRRVPARERKLDLAAKCWGEWPKVKKDEVQQLQWIVDQLNRKVSHDWTAVKRNWVSHHRAEIEQRSQFLHQELRRQNNNKGR